MPRSWYAFNGATTPTNPQFFPGNYSKMTVKPTCTTGSNICAIYLYHPSAVGPVIAPSPLSANVQQYITDGLGSGVPQPEDPLLAKRYVYLKQF